MNGAVRSDKRKQWEEAHAKIPSRFHPVLISPWPHDGRSLEERLAAPLAREEYIVWVEEES